MTKHTPGPWVSEPTYMMIPQPDRQVRAADSRIIVAECGYDGFKRVSHLVQNEDELMANARLIAAAPDLLAALEEMVKAMIDYEMEVDGDSTPRHRKMMDQARAAIAKAKGVTT